MKKKLFSISSVLGTVLHENLSCLVVSFLCNQPITKLSQQFGHDPACPWLGQVRKSIQTLEEFLFRHVLMEHFVINCCRNKLQLANSDEYTLNRNNTSDDSVLIVLR